LLETLLKLIRGGGRKTASNPSLLEKGLRGDSKISAQKIGKRERGSNSSSDKKKKNSYFRRPGKPENHQQK